MRKLLALLMLMASGSAATAAPIEFHFDGYADFRMIVPSDHESWMAGELGKLRYGANNTSPDFRFAELVGQGVALITPEIMVMGVVRIEPEQVTFLDVLEGFIRYRPVSTGAFRWSIKAGAFFAPIALENTDIGWTSPWTLTPSAINSWIGEELRTIGVEPMIEYRTEARRISAYAALYGWNDPAGVLVADRGWAMHDRFTGLIDKPREPDVIASAIGAPVPLRTWEFLEIDDKPGWYAGAAWDENSLGHLDVLFYNNETDPTRTRKNAVGWRTRFWNVGLRTEIGNVTLLAQGMTGETFIWPNAFYFSDTNFESAYLLAGWQIDQDWRVAGRFDWFQTAEYHPVPSPYLSEHGTSLTFAVNYLPNDWLRLTGEYVRVNSTRTQRILEGDAPKAIENQLQVSARFYLP
jgi:hypothetical protein